MRLGLVLLLLSSGCLCISLYAQQPADTSVQHLQQVPAKYVNSVQSKAQSVDAALTAKTQQYLGKLASIESKITAKLQKLNPSATTQLAPSSYDKYLGQLQGGAVSAPRTYVPGLDTMKTTLAFLQSNPKLTAAGQQLSGASGSVTQLEGHLNQSALIEQYITQRQQQLGTVLSKYSNLPGSITNAFNQYKATGYYYKAQVQAYKDMLNDPTKAEQTTIGLLSKTPAYQQFMARNSILASLFPAPGGGVGGVSPTVTTLVASGLQSRAQVQGMIQEQTSAGGASAQQGIQQQMQLAQSKLNSIKQQLAQYGSSGAGMDLPAGFQPNSQKTKTFLKRIEYGVSVQFAQSSYAFPATANLGLTLGYKISDKSTIGVGGSYMAGMGTGWGDITFSNQGVGLRSYMDWKIKGSYYVTGGYEENYMTQFSSIADLRNVSAWQKSALIGLERKYKISSKLTGNVQVLFDALYRQEIPQGQAIKFRVGYNF